MSYTLHWSDDNLKPPLTILAGATDSTSTALTLTGKGANAWGQMLQQNLLRLLENFATNGAAPAIPTIGQLWYDAQTNKLYLRTSDGTWTAIWPQPIPS